MPTKTNKASVSVRMPADMYQALKILANAEERSLSKQIVYALGEWMQMKRDEEDEEDENTTIEGTIEDVLRDGTKVRWSAVPKIQSPPGGISVNPVSVAVWPSPSQSPSVWSNARNTIQASPSDSYSPSASPSPSASESPSANPSAMETFRKWYNDKKPQGDK